MNKADRKQLQRIADMVDELARITPPSAMFQDGKYKVRVLSAVNRIQGAVKDMLNIDDEHEDDGEADSEESASGVKLA